MTTKRMANQTTVFGTSGKEPRNPKMHPLGSCKPTQKEAASSRNIAPPAFGSGNERDGSGNGEGETRIAERVTQNRDLALLNFQQIEIVHFPAQPV